MTLIPFLFFPQTAHRRGQKHSSALYIGGGGEKRIGVEET